MARSTEYAVCLLQPLILTLDPKGESSPRNLTGFDHGPVQSGCRVNVLREDEHIRRPSLQTNGISETSWLWTLFLSQAAKQQNPCTVVTWHVCTKTNTSSSSRLENTEECRKRALMSHNCLTQLFTFLPAEAADTSSTHRKKSKTWMVNIVQTFMMTFHWHFTQFSFSVKHFRKL